MLEFGTKIRKKEVVKNSNFYENIGRSIAALLNSFTSATLVITPPQQIGNLESSVLPKIIKGIEQLIENDIEPYVTAEITKQDNTDGPNIHVSCMGSNPPYSYKENFYIRTGEKNVLLDTPAIMKLLLDNGRKPKSWDRQISSKTVHDVEFSAFTSFTAKASANNHLQNMPDTIEGTLSYLGVTEGGLLTNAAALLFCSSTFPLITLNSYSCLNGEPTSFRIRGPLYKGISIVESELACELPEQDDFSLVKSALIYALCNARFERHVPIAIDIYPTFATVSYPSAPEDTSNLVSMSKSPFATSGTLSQEVTCLLFISGDIPEHMGVSSPDSHLESELKVTLTSTSAMSELFILR